MYKELNKDIWTGRIDSLEEVNSYRMHQVIKEKHVDLLPEVEKGLSVGLIGFECDEGVRRNKGRIGAAKGPSEIRKRLSSLPFHLTIDQVVDVGNVTCLEHKMEEAQQVLGTCVSKMLNERYVPIILGGGHETFYGHYLGVRQFIPSNATLGIINIDAHFDLRDEAIPSSGTMFRQVLQLDQHAGYLCLGIQPFGNTRSLFQTADEYGCTYLTEEEVQNSAHTFQVIDKFAGEFDYLILTLCMDAIKAAEAPGVSAPSPFGLDAKLVRNLIRYIAGKERLQSFDISETNPVLDENGKTTKLAAYYIAEFMQGLTIREEIIDN
ncbi:formimidoylglutamase [Roseburia sp. 1XD42-34]|nr:formimidoylglutamase [Roseburia sp. 1XD42-34]RKI77707.1 formimidoylglutamase [Clostridium sp. 1xD42-85]